MSGIDFNSNDIDLATEEKIKLINSIKSIIKTHTLCDDEWTKAITSQNFLVDLAFVLGMTHDESFTKLLDSFLCSFSPQFNGGYRVNERNILIIPDENKKLIECMIAEDKEDGYYVRGPLAASKINNPDKIYQNYLYGIMINISTAASNVDALNMVFKHCINELLNKESLEERGGWVHYRLPWITARIVLGLHNVLKNERLIIGSTYNDITYQVEKALNSLIERIYRKDNQYYWRSGAGEWVSKWESTGLCLEAFISSKDAESWIYRDEINEVIEYLFTEQAIDEWLPKESNMDFSTEESTNQLLAQIILCSVLYRYLKKPKWQKYANYRINIGNIFKECINKLSSEDEINVRQYCTMPQILYYIAKAIKD